MLSARISFLVLAFITVTCVQVQAQKIYFHYDNAGNRTERSLNDEPSESGARFLDDSDSTIIADKVSEEFQTILYPNASDGLFFIRMGETSGAVELYVFDIRGRMVYQNKYEQSQIRFDITDQSSGLYVVKWRNRDKSYIEKVLKR